MLHLLSLHEEFIKTYKKLMFKSMKKNTTTKHLSLPSFGCDCHPLGPQMHGCPAQTAPGKFEAWLQKMK